MGSACGDLKVTAIVTLRHHPFLMAFDAPLGLAGGGLHRACDGVEGKSFSINQTILTTPVASEGCDPG